MSTTYRDIKSIIYTFILCLTAMQAEARRSPAFEEGEGSYYQSARYAQAASNGHPKALAEIKDEREQAQIQEMPVVVITAEKKSNETKAAVIMKARRSIVFTPRVNAMNASFNSQNNFNSESDLGLTINDDQEAEDNSDNSDNLEPISYTEEILNNDVVTRPKVLDLSDSESLM